MQHRHNSPLTLWCGCFYWSRFGVKMGRIQYGWRRTSLVCRLSYAYWKRRSVISWKAVISLKVSLGCRSRAALRSRAARRVAPQSLRRRGCGSAGRPDPGWSISRLERHGASMPYFGGIWTRLTLVPTRTRIIGRGWICYPRCSWRPWNLFVQTKLEEAMERILVVLEEDRSKTHLAKVML